MVSSNYFNLIIIIIIIIIIICLKFKKNISGELENYSRQHNKLSSRILIKGINTWVVSHVRYLGPFLKQMDQRTRKLMTMHKALHPKDDVDRQYVCRKQRKKTCSIEDSVDASIQRLEDYIEKHERGLMTAIRNDTDITIDDRMTITRKQKWVKTNSMAALND